MRMREGGREGTPSRLSAGHGALTRNQEILRNTLTSQMTFVYNCGNCIARANWYFSAYSIDKIGLTILCVLSACLNRK